MQQTTREWQQLDASHHLHPFTDFQALNKKGSRIITKASGVYLEDSDGKRILDGMAGLWCVNMGYGRQELVDAATRQMQQLPYYNLFFQTAHPPVIQLATLLAESRRLISTKSSLPAPAPSATTPCCGWCATTGPARGSLINR